MTIRLLPAIIVLVSACLSLAQDVRLPRDDVLVIGTEQGKPIRAKTPEQWKPRRQAIIDGMQRIMGQLPDASHKVPLDVTIESEEDCGSYVRRLITYGSEANCRTPAYLLIPKAALNGSPNKVPAILCLHPTTNIGHKVVVGLGGRANRQYASELAERGYVTLAPSYPLLAEYQPDLDALGWTSGTLKAVWDNMRGIDLLQSLPFVDASAIGAIGHSLGGHNSVYTAVLDDRIRVIVSSCGLDSYLDYFGGDASRWKLGAGWTSTHYMPRLAEYRGRLQEIPFDFHELIAALAPRHVLIIAPLHDGNFKADSVDRVATAARSLYRLYGTESRLRVEHPDCSHDFPGDMRQIAYRLFDDVLRK